MGLPQIMLSDFNQLVTNFKDIELKTYFKITWLLEVTLKLLMQYLHCFFSEGTA